MLMPLVWDSLGSKVLLSKRLTKEVFPAPPSPMSRTLTSFKRCCCPTLKYSIIAALPCLMISGGGFFKGLSFRKIPLFFYNHFPNTFLYLMKSFLPAIYLIDFLLNLTFSNYVIVPFLWAIHSID